MIKLNILEKLKNMFLNSDESDFANLKDNLINKFTKEI